MLAIPAFPIHPANPRDSHSRPDWQLGSRSLHNFANNLVSGNQCLTTLRKFAFHNMQVRAAHATRSHAKKHLPCRRLRLRNLFDAKRALRNLLRRPKDCSFHWTDYDRSARSLKPPSRWFTTRPRRPRLALLLTNVHVI